MSFTNLPNANPNFWSFQTNNTPHSGPDMNAYAHVVPRPSLEQDNRSLGRRRFFPGPSPGPGQGLQGTELPAKRARKDRHDQDQYRDQDDDDMMIDDDDMMMDDDTGYEADYETDCELEIK